MPRRGDITPRAVEPDKLHNSRLVQQVINKVMADGKKSTAEKITYEALDILGRKSGKEPVEALEQSIKVLTPGARGPLAPGRRRDLPGAGRGARPPRPHARRPLAGRVRAPAPREVDGRAARERAARRGEQQGDAYKRKDDIYRMAQANKAFAHYRW